MADSLKELRARVKELRAKNCGAVVSKATIDQLRSEIAHHESAVRQREQAEKRKAALQKAREVKASKSKPEEESKKPAREKKAEASGRSAKDELTGKSAKRPVKRVVEEEEKPKVRKVKAVVEESSEPVLAKNMRRKVKDAPRDETSDDE